jgi:hypothetical protein
MRHKAACPLASGRPAPKIGVAAGKNVAGDAPVSRRRSSAEAACYGHDQFAGDDPAAAMTPRGDGYGDETLG